MLGSIVHVGFRTRKDGSRVDASTVHRERFNVRRVVVGVDGVEQGFIQSVVFRLFHRVDDAADGFKLIRLGNVQVRFGILSGCCALALKAELSEFACICMWVF